MKPYLTILLVIALLMITPREATSQCSMCKQNAENSLNETDQRDAKSLNYGIMYLLVIPYALVGGIGYWWYLGNKKKSQKPD
jgi:hypothetical protein